MKKTVNIQLEHSNSYNIHYGTELWDKIREYVISDRNPTGQLVMVIDENVEKLHGRLFAKELLDQIDRVISYTVPEGESSKNVEQWRKIADTLLRNGVRRNTPMIAAGGGVTGDLAGFAAATVMRGIPLIHFPTTLLAMVDSAIGGKTGINHSTGKNLIGSFYQPEAVFGDISLLRTLDEQEWINGLSEILKYGAIRDETLINEVNRKIRISHFDSPEDWLSIIHRSAEIKADIVVEDVHESGVREFLNFGHTFAHALETATDYDQFSHGEAVFLGMHAALYASRKVGAEINPERFERFNDLYELDTGGVDSRIDELIELMYRDKKVKHNSMRLILLKDWERPYVKECNEHDLLRESWRFAFNQFS